MGAFAGQACRPAPQAGSHGTDGRDRRVQRSRDHNTQSHGSLKPDPQQRRQTVDFSQIRSGVVRQDRSITSEWSWPAPPRMPQTYQAYYENGVLTWLGGRQPEGPARLVVTVEEVGAEGPLRRQPSPRVAGKGQTLGDLIQPIVEDQDWGDKN